MPRVPRARARSRMIGTPAIAWSEGAPTARPAGGPNADARHGPGPAPRAGFEPAAYSLGGTPRVQRRAHGGSLAPPDSCLAAVRRPAQAERQGMRLTPLRY